MRALLQQKKVLLIEKAYNTHTFHLVDVSPWPILKILGLLGGALGIVSWLTLGLIKRILELLKVVLSAYNIHPFHLVYLVPWLLILKGIVVIGGLQVGGWVTLGNKKIISLFLLFVGKILFLLYLWNCMKCYIGKLYGSFGLFYWLLLLLSNNNNKIIVPVPLNLSSGIQDPVMEWMLGVIRLHDVIIFYSIIFGISLFWLGITIGLYFYENKNKVDLAPENLIELIWTIFPALILCMMGIPILKLLYKKDEIRDSEISFSIFRTFLAEGLEVDIESDCSACIDSDSDSDDDSYNGSVGGNLKFKNDYLNSRGKGKEIPKRTDNPFKDNYICSRQALKGLGNFGLQYEGQKEKVIGELKKPYDWQRSPRGDYHAYNNIKNFANTGFHYNAQGKGEINNLLIFDALSKIGFIHYGWDTGKDPYNKIGKKGDSVRTAKASDIRASFIGNYITNIIGIGLYDVEVIGARAHYNKMASEDFYWSQGIFRDGAHTSRVINSKEGIMQENIREKKGDFNNHIRLKGIKNKHIYNTPEDRDTMDRAVKKWVEMRNIRFYKWLEVQNSRRG